MTRREFFLYYSLSSPKKLRFGLSSDFLSFAGGGFFFPLKKKGVKSATIDYCIICIYVKRIKENVGG